MDSKSRSVSPIGLFLRFPEVLSDSDISPGGARQVVWWTVPVTLPRAVPDPATTDWPPPRTRLITQRTSSAMGLMLYLGARATRDPSYLIRGEEIKEGGGGSEVRQLGREGVGVGAGGGRGGCCACGFVQAICVCRCARVGVNVSTLWL